MMKKRNFVIKVLRCIAIILFLLIILIVVIKNGTNSHFKLKINGHFYFMKFSLSIYSKKFESSIILVRWDSISETFGIVDKQLITKIIIPYFRIKTNHFDHILIKNNFLMI